MGIGLQAQNAAIDAQFDTFVDSLPDPELDPNPSDPPNAQTLV